MKINESLFKHKITSESVRFGIILASIGGFLDAYTYIGEGHVFANAQTGNIVLIAVSLSKGDLYRAIISFLPVIAFVLGVFLSEYVRRNITTGLLGGWEVRILITEGIILFIIGFLPKDFSSVIVTICIAFVSSIQISSFKKLVNSPFSTTIVTGNLRSATEALFSYLVNGDKNNRDKSIRYFIIIFFFIIGAGLGGYLTIKFERKSIWFVDILILFAIIQFKIDKYYFRKEIKV